MNSEPTSYQSPGNHGNQPTMDAEVTDYNFPDTLHSPTEATSTSSLCSQDNPTSQGILKEPNDDDKQSGNHALRDPPTQGLEGTDCLSPDTLLTTNFNCQATNADLNNPSSQDARGTGYHAPDTLPKLNNSNNQSADSDSDDPPPQQDSNPGLQNPMVSDSVPAPTDGSDGELQEIVEVSDNSGYTSPEIRYIFFIQRNTNCILDLFRGDVRITKMRHIGEHTHTTFFFFLYSLGIPLKEGPDT